MGLTLILLCFSLLPLATHGHGNMMLPTTWMDPGGKIGLRNPMNCVGTFSSCLWFTNYTFTPGKPTLDPSLWTYTKLLSHKEPVFNPQDLDYTGCQHKTSKLSPNMGQKETSEIMSNDIPPLEDFFYNHPWRSPGSAQPQLPMGRETLALGEALAMDQVLRPFLSEMWSLPSGEQGRWWRLGGVLMQTMEGDTHTDCARFLRE